MKLILTSELTVKDIPIKYERSSFSKFALSYNPFLDSENWQPSYEISLDRMPNRNDSIVGIRAYLYCLQRVSNQLHYDLNGFEEKIEHSYNLLREKLNTFI